MTDGIKFTVRGIEELKAYFKQLPYGTLREALRAVTEYLIGNESHGLKHPDPYKYVSRAAAYGVVKDGVPAGYFSMKQFRYVMARIADGSITPGQSKRTGDSTDAWQYVQVSDYQYTITNPEPGAYWTRDDYGQARQPGMVGWRKVAQVIADNLEGAMRAANAAVSKWLKS
jgi:hypothetical protein